MSGRAITRGLACATAGLLALSLRAAAQSGSGATRPAAGTAANPAATASMGDIDRYTPVKAQVMVEGMRRMITILGRSATEIAYSDAQTPGAIKRLKVEQIQECRFEMNLDYTELLNLLNQRNWTGAVRLLFPVVKPTLPYLDLFDNNAASQALQVGDLMIRAADQQSRKAETEDAQKLAEEQYKTAYTILKYAGRAQWQSSGAIATLKSLKCLMALGKPKTARHYLEQLDEPMVGDAAYGLYWLIKAELEVLAENWRGAMQAAVNSVCFENKDVDTFPDALLISAQCYEEMQEWYRARDVYYEVAKIFPNSDWSDIAIARLRFIAEKGLTAEKEERPIENVFFAFSEDMNELVQEFLDGLEKTAADIYADVENQQQYDEKETIKQDLSETDDPAKDLINEE